MPRLPAEQDALGSVTTSGGDVIQRDKIISGDEVRGNKYVTVLGAERPLLYVGVPPMPPYFFGRTELVDELVNRLCAGQTTALSADGLPGVGKTTLAVALARDPRLLAHFHDGILWAGLGRTPDVASIQATWADALGVELRNLIDPYTRTQRLTNAIGNRRLLLVLDDVWQWEAAAQLCCSAPQVATLLTTRDQAIARRFAGTQQRVNVPVLAPQPAYDLLAALAPEACASDPAAAHRLAALVDGLPLALELLGGYLSASRQRRTHARRQQALTVLTDPAARLALATQRLGDPQHKEVTLQETIALSLADLPATAVAAFHALGAFAPKPARFDLPAALAVTGADEETLFTLADRNLVEMAADETLALHQILSILACTQLPVQAISRHRDYYLALVNEDQEDWQRIEIIYPQFSHAGEQQITIQSTDKLVVTLADSINTYQRRRGLRHDEIRWQNWALSVVQVDEDQYKIAKFLNNIGVAYSELGDKQQALTYYERTLTLDRQINNKSSEAITLNNIGSVYFELGNRQQALNYFEQALSLRRQMGDKAYEAFIINNIGRAYDALGDKKQAHAYYEQALLLSHQMGNKADEATILNNIGSLYNDLGDKQQALVYYKQALPLRRQTGDKKGETSTLNNIGHIYDGLGDKQQAMVYYEQALLLSRQVSSKASEATVLDNIGSVYNNLGDKQQAMVCYEQALSLRRQVGDKAGEAVTLNNIGCVYDALGDKQQALGHYEQALPLRRQVGDKEGEATTLNNLGRVYDALGDKQAALDYYAQALPLSRQVGDRRQESITCFNMALVYRSLGELAMAEQLLLRTVELDEAIGHPDPASDRAMLEQVQQERQAR